MSSKNDEASPSMKSSSKAHNEVGVINSLERNHLINQFCNNHMGDYSIKFQPVSKTTKGLPRAFSFKRAEIAEPDEVPLYALSQVESRFVWFRDFMKDISAKFPEAPHSHCNLFLSITRRFLDVTRKHFFELLDGPKKDKEATNATVLARAMQTTIKFEKEMMIRLERDFGITFVKVPDTKLVSQEGRKNVEGEVSKENGKVEHLLGIASTAFEKYMFPYIALEKQNMDEQMVKALEDKTVESRDKRQVYTSSTSLFIYINGSITRCNALSKGHVFFLLYQTFKDSLRRYAQVLSEKLPSPMTTWPCIGGLSIGGSLSSFPKDENSKAVTASYKISEGEEVTVCYVISTCEYCVDTIEELERLIHDTIEKKYESKIDMMAEQEVFNDLIAKCVRILVSGLQIRIENAIKMMSSINWGYFDGVGEESVYVRLMQDEIYPYAASLCNLLHKSYFRSFCDKFATSFTEVYYDAIIKLKHINEAATQQLLLDVYSLKTFFLKLHDLEVTNPPMLGPQKIAVVITPTFYTKMVEEKFGRIEKLLKLVGTPAELLIDVFKLLCVGSALDLQTIISLKGMKRTDQFEIMEKFRRNPLIELKRADSGVTETETGIEAVEAQQDHSNSVAVTEKSDTDEMMRQRADYARRSKG